MPTDDGPVVIYDDEGYYMGGVLAEACVRAERAVALVTPAPLVSPWTAYTLEQRRIQARLIELGVAIHANRLPRTREGDVLNVACTFTGRGEAIACHTLVAVTARLPNRRLYDEVMSREADFASAGIETVRRIGDCLAPATIAAAVHSGHLYARDFGEAVDPDAVPFHREPITVE